MIVAGSRLPRVTRPGLLVLVPQREANERERAHVVAPSAVELDPMSRTHRDYAAARRGDAELEHCERERSARLESRAASEAARRLEVRGLRVEADAAEGSMNHGLGHGESVASLDASREVRS